MPRALIGNFRGPQGPKGDSGIIDSNSVIEFEDFSGETELSNPSTALQNILTGRSISSLLCNIKAFLKNTLTTEKIANNFATTDTKMVAAAPTVKQLKDEVNEIKTNLGYEAKTLTKESNISISSSNVWRQGKTGHIIGNYYLNTGTGEVNTYIKIGTTDMIPIQDGTSKYFPAVAGGGVVGFCRINSAGVVECQFPSIININIGIFINCEFPLA